MYDDSLYDITQNNKAAAKLRQRSCDILIRQLLTMARNVINRRRRI